MRVRDARITGETTWVACETVLPMDPHVEGLIARLRIGKAEAIGFVALWRMFVLSKGDGVTGEVRGYSVAAVAGFCGFRGNPDRFLDAMKGEGFMVRRGGVLIYPEWSSTITGQYHLRREEYRQAERDRKARARVEAAGGEAAPAAAGGVPSDLNSGVNLPAERGGASTGTGQEGAHRSIKVPPEGSPLPPSGGVPSGGGPGKERWIWFRKHHPKPLDERVSTEILGRLDDATWALVQWACIRMRPPYASATHARKLANGRLFLSRGDWDKWRSDYEASLAKSSGKTPPALTIEEIERRKAAADIRTRGERIVVRANFVLGALADADTVGEQKAKFTKELDNLRTEWREVAGATPPPWDQAPSAPRADLRLVGAAVDAAATAQ